MIGERLPTSLLTRIGVGAPLECLERQFPLDEVDHVNSVSVEIILNRGQELPASLLSRVQVVEVEAGMLQPLSYFDRDVSGRIEQFCKDHLLVENSAQGQEFLRRLILEHAPTRTLKQELIVRGQVLGQQLVTRALALSRREALSLTTLAAGVAVIVLAYFWTSSSASVTTGTNGTAV